MSMNEWRKRREELEQAVATELVADGLGQVDCQEWCDAVVRELSEAGGLPEGWKLIYCRMERADFVHSWLEVVKPDGQEFVWDGSRQFVDKTWVEKKEVSDERYQLGEDGGVSRERVEFGWG